MNDLKKSRIGDKAMWPPRENSGDHAPLSGDFTKQILERTTRRATIADYLFMFLQGFVGIVVGLLKGVPGAEKKDAEKET